MSGGIPGHYERPADQGWQGMVGGPKLRQQTFETAIIERSVARKLGEEALIEMYLGGSRGH